MALGVVQVAVIASLISAAGAGVAAYNFGHSAGYDLAAKKAEQVIKAKNAEISTQGAELAQCRAANNGYHNSVAVELQRINAELQRNAEAQQTAQKKNAQADVRMMDAAKKSAENYDLARKAIQDAAERCLRESVPADYIELLNGILPGAQGRVGSDTVSASQAGH